MNTIRSFVRHVLEEHNVLNRLIMQEGGAGPDGQDLPSGLEQSLGYPVLEHNNEYRNKSAVLTDTLQTNKSSIIANVTDMFDKIPQPGMNITDEDELKRAVAILKLLNDDRTLMNNPEIEFPYNTALFVIGWENEQQSPADTLAQITLNTSKILKSSHDDAEKPDPRARRPADVRAELGLPPDTEVIQVPDAEQPDAKIINVPDIETSNLEVAALGIGGLVGVYFGRAGLLHFFPALMKHASAEYLAKKAINLAKEIEPTGFLKSGTVKALRYMSDSSNAAKFKKVYATAIEQSQGGPFEVLFRSWALPQARDTNLQLINNSLNSRKVMAQIISKTDDIIMFSPDASISAKNMNVIDQSAAAWLPSTSVGPIEQLANIENLKPGAASRLADIRGALSLIGPENIKLSFGSYSDLFTRETVREAESEFVYALIQTAAGNPDIAKMSISELKDYFKSNLSSNLASLLNTSASANTQKFASLISIASKDKTGESIFCHIMADTGALKSYTLSPTATAAFKTFAGEANKYTDSIAEITAALFGRMIRSAPTALSGKNVYAVGTATWYTIYAIGVAAVTYLGYETIIGSDSNNTAVTEEEAKILLTDLHIRASAKDSMSLISSAGWWRGSEFFGTAANKISLDDADAQLADIFMRKPDEPVMPSDIEQTMILYRTAIKSYSTNYVSELSAEGIDLENIDSDVTGYIAANKAKIEKANLKKADGKLKLRSTPKK